MAIPRNTAARYWTVRDRQWRDAWGKDYVAAIWATPTEAPSLSRATTLTPRKMAFRDFHTLSRSETAVALLALYHPRVWDIHEQRVLFPEPRPHYLYGHPMSNGAMFRPFKGTLAVCERMGLVRRHQTCRLRLQSGESLVAPFPFVGDLLSFLYDKDGPYVINLNVKDKLEDFERKIPRPGKVPNRAADQRAAERSAIEEAYYRDAEIDTRRAAGREIDFELRCNLLELFASDVTPTTVPNPTVRAIWQYFETELGSAKKARVIAEDVGRKIGVDTRSVLEIMKKGIWNRAIKADLFRPINPDRPLRREVDDPIDVYRNWFARG